MKEKTKKMLLMAALIAVAVLLVAGISMRLYKDKKNEIPASAEAPIETEVMVDTEIETVPETESETEELVIETEPQTNINSTDQNLQPDPVKTEEEKPTEAPAVKEDSNLENPAAEPQYEEPATKPAEQTTGTTTSSTPKTGDMKDGQMYVEGFGWVPYEGEGSGVVAEDMYENGNKIGIMD